MEPFRTLTSLAAPLDRTNVDTDQIIPKQFLKRIERTGYGDFLFFDWRQTPEGEPDAGVRAERSALQGRADSDRRQEFCMRFEPRTCRVGAERLRLSRCVIAPTFADIFFSNAGKNGIVLVRLSEEQVAELLHKARDDSGIQADGVAGRSDSDGRTGIQRNV